MFSPLDVGYGSNRCEIRIEGGDALPADDASVFVVRRSDPGRVLFVHASTDTRSPVYFSAALDAATQGSFLVQSVAEAQATDLEPTKYAFVVLSDVATLPSIFEHALEQYVAKGGNVLVALGTSTAHQPQIPLWAGGVMDQHDYARTGNPATIGQVDFSYPPTEQAEPGHDNGGWADVRVLYAAVLNPEGARVAARLTDGTPLLLEKQIGEGRVVLLTSGLDNLTNDLPLHPVFVAFIDHTTRYLAGSERLSGSKLVDSFLQVRATTPQVGAVSNVEVIDPAGRRPLSLSEARTVQSLRLERAGFYQVRFANGQDAVIAVNPDRRESDLAPLADDVQKLWSGGPSATASPNAAAASVEVSDQAVSLWWYVMLFALLMALAETTLASRYMGTAREEV